MIDNQRLTRLQDFLARLLQQLLDREQASIHWQLHHRLAQPVQVYVELGPPICTGLWLNFLKDAQGHGHSLEAVGAVDGLLAVPLGLSQQSELEQVRQLVGARDTESIELREHGQVGYESALVRVEVEAVEGEDGEQRQESLVDFALDDPLERAVASGELAEGAQREACQTEALVDVVHGFLLVYQLEQLEVGARNAVHCHLVRQVVRVLEFAADLGARLVLDHVESRVQLFYPVALADVDLLDFLDQRPIHLGEQLHLVLYGLESYWFAFFGCALVESQPKLGAA